MILGHHLICDLEFLCVPTMKKMQQMMKESCIFVEEKILHSNFHTFELDKPNIYLNTAYTGIIHLEESHMSIHTWPEYNTGCLDIFMCGLNSKKQVEKCLRNLEFLLYKNKNSSLDQEYNIIQRRQPG